MGHDSQNRQLARLSQALRAARSPYAMRFVAGEIADLATPGAFQRLIAEVVDAGGANDACILALAAAGDAAVPHVREALAGNPDCDGLVLCLRGPLEPETVDRLIGVCGRTAEPWVVRHCAERVLKADPDRAGELSKVVRGRCSDAMLTALEVGLAAAHPERYTDRLKPYLAEGAAPEVQDLALTVREALDLPEGEACLRRKLRSRRARERRYGLRLVGKGELHGFAGAALDALVEDASEGVRCTAFEAIRSISEAVAEQIPSRVDRFAAELRGVATAVNRSWRRGSDRQELITGMRGVSAAHEALSRLLVAAWLSGADYGEVMLPGLEVANTACAALGPLCEDGDVGEVACLVVNDLLRFSLGRCRDAWLAGHPGARVMVARLTGLCVVALSNELPVPPYAARRAAWDALLEELRARSEEVVDCMLPELGGAGVVETGLEGVPLLLRYLPGAAIERGVLRTGFRDSAVLRRALSALTESLDREQRTRSRAVKAVGEDVVAGMQTALNDQATIMLSPYLCTIGQFLETHHFLGGAESAPQLAPARPILVEQVLQSALLGVVSQNLSPEAGQVLIRCLRSSGALVAECAERLLARIGEAALPQLVAAAARTRSDLHRARLLEVCRCVHATSALDLAREHIGSDHVLLSAVSAKVIGQVGTPADAPALRARVKALDELVDVCALEALGRLDPDPSSALFSLLLASAYPGTRWAAFNALARCSDDVLTATLAPHLESANVFRREAAEQLLGAPPDRRQRWPRFEGSAFDVAGDAWLGWRLPAHEGGPWEWGIAALMPDTQMDWDTLAEFIGTDGELADLWIRYTMSGNLPPAMSRRLHEIARESGAETATRAADLLWALHVGNYSTALGACLEYRGVEASEESSAGAAELLLALLLGWSADALLDGLAVPSATRHDSLGEALLVRGDADVATMLEYALSVRFIADLPQALNLPDASLPPEDDPVTRCAAIESEWRRLLAFEDMGFGFWVKPRIGLGALQWYCQQRGAAVDIKHAVVNYIVCTATVLPQHREEREATVQCLLGLFAPLIRKTARRLVDIREGSLATEEARGQLEQEFRQILAGHDAFWAETKPAVFPLGTVSSTVEELRGRSQGAFAGFGVVSTHLPFAHRVRRRFEELVRKEKAEARRDAELMADAEDALDRAVNQQGRRHLAASRAPDDEALSDGEFIALQAGAAEAYTRRGPLIATRDIEEGGRMVPCVDIATAAAHLNTTVGALQQRERRGKARFLRHGGRRYLPAEQLAELAASRMTNERIAAELGVHEGTVRRWKQEAPSGLGILELMRYLRARAEDRPARPRGASS